MQTKALCFATLLLVLVSVSAKTYQSDSYVKKYGYKYGHGYDDKHHDKGVYYKPPYKGVYYKLPEKNCAGLHEQCGSVYSGHYKYNKKPCCYGLKCYKKTIIHGKTVTEVSKCEYEHGAFYGRKG